MKICTINVCGVNNKIEELVEEIEKRNIPILGLADTRTKGNGCKKIHQDYTYIYSGVNEKERAKHGVGFIIDPDMAKTILKIEYISERVIKITTRENGVNNTYIQIYAPCNTSSNDEECKNFFDSINETINKIPDEDNYIIMGDFNARIGCDRLGVEEYLGPFGDKNNHRNENGCRLLELCNLHNLFITNTHFNHRESQLYTWYKWSDLGCKSQIDFILAKRTCKRWVLDSRAIPNMCIDTDHKAVMMTIRRNRLQATRKHNKTGKETYKVNKLKEETIKKEYLQLITEEFNSLPTNNTSVEEEWTMFKKAIQDAAERTCGSTKNRRMKPQITAWWNEDVKTAIKEKKHKYRKWIYSKQPSDLMDYRITRKHVKGVVKKAKEQAWLKYGEMLNSDYKDATKQFYKKIGMNNITQQK